MADPRDQQQMLGWSFSEAARQVDRIVGTVPAGPIAKQRTDESKLLALTKVWDGARGLQRGDPVWLYLNRRLGLQGN
jgi:putative DNA primase/helicase